MFVSAVRMSVAENLSVISGKVTAAFTAETICSKMEARGAGPAGKKLKQK